MEDIQRLVDFDGIQSNVSLKDYSTFKIGGRVKYFFEANTKRDLVSVVALSKKLNIPFFVIGGGSKLLISDDGFYGLVVRANNSNFKINGNNIEADAGFLMGRLIQIALKQGLTGIEWLAGIPGTIGGAISGNAGAFGGSVQDVIDSVNVINLETGKEEILNNDECLFSYRSSLFKKNHNLVILSCVINLKKGNKEEIKKKMNEYFVHRRNFHPLQFPSVGCIFKNPILNGKELPAWKVIVDCGLSGKRIGNVEVSEKHSNFIVNLGGGSSQDVKELIKVIKDTVKEKIGVEMKEEVQYLP